ARHARWAHIVHTHLLRADLATAPIATLLGARAKLVSSKHNDERALLSPIVARLHGWIGRLPGRTIVLSDHVGRFVARHGGIDPAHIVRIYYGIDPAPFEAASRMDAGERTSLRAELSLGERDIGFVCVARFAPQKAHDVLLAAFARALAESGPAQAPLRLVL